jgi:hypothetical protein
MSTRTLAKVPGGGMQMATGTYTGDGAATQAIVGLGFQPKFLIIYRRDDSVWFDRLHKADVDGLLAMFNFSASGNQYCPDTGISLDADGFTVGDGTGCATGNVFNINEEDYTYIAFG